MKPELQKNNSSENATLIEDKMNSEGQRSLNCLDCIKWFVGIFCSTDFMLIFILFLYTLFGACTIHEFESQRDRIDLRAPNSESLRIKRLVSLEMCRVFCTIPNGTDLFATTENFANTTMLPDVCRNISSCFEKVVLVLKSWKLIKPALDPWSIGDSLTYVMTIHTTIGYGSLAPVTAGGRTFTIFYALFGIPLALCVLARIGDFFCLIMHKFWSHIRSLLCGYVVVRDVELEKIAVEQRDFPLLLALGVTFGWLMASASMFEIWEEDWSFFTAFYFSFITLSTIGLGDVLPSTTEGVIANLASITVGLALVSMCINLLQTKLETLQIKILYIIQRKYATAQTDDLAMSYGDTNVDSLLASNADYRFISAMLGKNKKRILQQEWQRYANMRLKSTQTDVASMYQEQGIQCNLNNVDLAIPEDVEAHSLDDYGLQYKETPLRWNSTRKTDDVKRILHEVHNLLDDCREIAKSESFMSNLNDVVAESPD